MKKFLTTIFALALAAICAGPVGLLQTRGASYVGVGDIVSGWRTYWDIGYSYSLVAAKAGQNDALLVDASTGATTYTMTLLPNGQSNWAGAAASSACAVACKVKTLYDQTLSGNDLTQATLASMPTLTFNCQGGAPCISFSGAQFLATTGNISVALVQPFTVLDVSNDSSPGTNAAHLASSTSSELGILSYFNTNYSIYAGNTNGYSMGYTQNVWHSLQSNVQQSSAAVYIDGSSPAFTNSATIGTNGLSASILVGRDVFNNFATMKMGSAGLLPVSLTAPQNAAINSVNHSHWGF